uniref:Uncharacterized protein n=2 Tax=viral metagenome TaxID=1070528 RepID=A0A6M3ISC2_9ZZZZ
MKLIPENVYKIMVDCLFKEGENSENAIKVEGITHNIGFHPERIKEHSNEIKELLAHLPKEFHKDNGGGMSFLNACINDKGDQWGEHIDMEALFTLGMAGGYVKTCLPKELWSLLPGGMPYYVVNIRE